MINIKGTGVALVTPMERNGEIDYKSLEQLVLHVLDDVDYLVVLGTTGESATLTTREKLDVIQACISVCDKKKPIVIGYGGNDTEKLIRQLDEYDWDGIEAILSVTPYYNKPSQAGLHSHYMALADSSPRPVILYNVPGRTGCNMSASTTLSLAQHPNIIGIKEASGLVEQAMAIAAEKPEDFVLLSGDDMLTPALIAIGAEGVISVLANVFPAEFSQMVCLCRAGHYDQAARIWSQWLKLNPLLYEEGNPVGIKAALAMKGIARPFLRLPLKEASMELVDKLAAVLPD